MNTPNIIIIEESQRRKRKLDFGKVSKSKTKDENKDNVKNNDKTNKKSVEISK